MAQDLLILLGRRRRIACVCDKAVNLKLLIMKFYCKTEIPDWEHKAKLANYRVKGFARLVGMSKTTLQRFFREHVGKTAKQWAPGNPNGPRLPPPR